MIYTIVYFVAKIILGRNPSNIPSMFVIQAIFGTVVNSPMWYQFDLFVLTLLFFICYSVSAVIGRWITGFLGVLAIILQYTGINQWLFSGIDDIYSIPLGRLCEMMPYAVLGVALSYFEKKIMVRDSFNRLSFRSKTVLHVAMMLVSVCIVMMPDVLSVDGYGYSGVKGLLVAVSMFCFVLFLPDSCFSERIKGILNKAGGLTLGIYCMHSLIGGALSAFLGRMGMRYDGGMGISLAVFMTCLAAGYVIQMSPYRWMRYLVR